MSCGWTATTGGLAAATSGGGGAGATAAVVTGKGEGGCETNHQAPPPMMPSSATASATAGAPGRFAGVATGMVRGVAAAAPGGGATTMVVSSSRTAGSAGFASAVRIASAKALAEANRSSGRFAIARRTTASNDGGAVTESCDGAGGSVFSALCMIADMPPSNGRSPVSN